MKKSEEFKKYKQLLKVRTGESSSSSNFHYERYIVISKTIDDKISMAQQMRVPDRAGEPQLVFLKNSIIFETVESFEEFREKLLNLKIEE